MEEIMPKEKWLPLLVPLATLAWWGSGMLSALTLPSLAMILGVTVCAVVRPKFALPAFFYLCIFAVVVASRASLTSLLLPAIVGLVVLQFTRGSYKCVMVACLCALPIAGLSGSAGSAGGWQESLTAWFGLGLQQADLVVLCIRRTIHFVAYGTIALTFYRSAIDLRQMRRTAAAVVWVASHAAFDELRQHLTPGRSGRAQDALIDLIGAATFLVIAWALARRRLRSTK